MAPLPYHSPEAADTGRSVVIDFSNFTLQQATNDHFSVTGLVEWVRSLPAASAVHVYLPSDRVIQNTKQLQRSLLSMGCTVTKRLPVCLN